MPKKFPKILTVVFLTYFSLQLANFLILTPQPARAVNDSMPKLQVPIPDVSLPGEFLKFSKMTCTGEGKNKTCSIPWIAEYIAAVYKYAIGIVGILATVVMMVGGIIWLTAGGNATRVGEAKSWIGASLTGLIIALSSYMILYQINPDLIKLKPITIGIVSALEEVQKQFATQGCPTDEEKTKGFEAFITGYCKPLSAGYSVNKDNFLCNVGLNCSCPKGRSDQATCSNSKGFTWKPCLDFDPDTTAYCNQTASGDSPATDQVAADWNCFPEGSTVNINGLGTFTVTDKGSAIKGRRFDVWVDDCNKAKDITGIYTVK